MRARGVDVDQLARAAAISNSRLHEMMQGERKPSIVQVQKLASKLAVPPYAFYADKYYPEEDPLLDFRWKDVRQFKPGLLAPQFERFFGLVELIKDINDDVNIDLQSASLEESPEQIAAAMRAKLRLDDIQFTATSASLFYAEFRKRIEELGVFVIHTSLKEHRLRGFALFDNSMINNIIGINTFHQNHASRSFTLAHELAHIMLKNSGVSDTLRVRNDVERFCNRFAISLLAPRRSIVQDFDDFEEFTDYDDAVDVARTLSTKYRISISALLLRAVELGYTRRANFAIWRSNFKNDDWLDAITEIRRRPKDQKPDPGKNAIGRFGLRLSRLLRNGIKSGKISEFDVHEGSGLSLKTINSMLRATDAQIQQAQQEVE